MIDLAAFHSAGEEPHPIGYAAPEQMSADPTKIGPWTDVFPLAATVFYALTGNDYFDSDHAFSTVRSGNATKRRRLLDEPLLDDELRARRSACEALDQLFERATSKRPEDRPPTAALFAASALGCLNVEARSSRRTEGFSLQRLRMSSTRVADRDVRLRWSVTARPSHERVVRSVAWNSDGRCLVATTKGLAFWDGSTWHELSSVLPGATPEVRFVRRVTPGEWLIGGDHGMLATLGAAGCTPLQRGPDRAYSVQLASGDREDIAIFVLAAPGATPLLQCVIHDRWLRPLPLDGVTHVNAVARINDEQWLIVGRGQRGGGYAATFSPLEWSVNPIPVGGGALLACAARPETGVGLATGADGAVYWFDGGVAARTLSPGAIAIASCAIDPSDRIWVGTRGALLHGTPGGTEWTTAWFDEQWQSPIVSVYADGAVVFAMSADGGILEGRPALW